MSSAHGRFGSLHGKLATFWPTTSLGGSAPTTLDCYSLHGGLALFVLVLCVSAVASTRFVPPPLLLLALSSLGQALNALPWTRVCRCYRTRVAGSDFPWRLVQPLTADILRHTRVCCPNSAPWWSTSSFLMGGFTLRLFPSLRASANWCACSLSEPCVFRLYLRSVYENVVNTLLTSAFVHHTAGLLAVPYHLPPAIAMDAHLLTLR